MRGKRTKYRGLIRVHIREGGYGELTALWSAAWSLSQHVLKGTVRSADDVGGALARAGRRNRRYGDKTTDRQQRLH